MAVVCHQSIWRILNFIFLLTAHCCSSKDGRSRRSWKYFKLCITYYSSENRCVKGFSNYENNHIKEALGALGLIEDRSSWPIWHVTLDADLECCSFVFRPGTVSCDVRQPLLPRYLMRPSSQVLSNFLDRFRPLLLFVGKYNFWLALTPWRQFILPRV